jgi:thymidine phosphorylase
MQPDATPTVLQALDAAREGCLPLGGWPLEALGQAPDYQLTALAIYASDDATLVKWMKGARPAALEVAREASAGRGTPPWSNICCAVIDQISIKKVDLSQVVAELLNGSIDRGRLAAWLALCVRHGLPASSVASLTYVLRDSGSVLDIRGTLGSMRLVRRYPTGTVSEKVALTLPALVSLVSEDVGAVTPVIVARSLGFAGGTWDKLDQIPGFQFLDSQQIRHVLGRVGAGYIVPSASLAPADRELYSFRAMTGTVDSLPLIAASIASKHLAMPIDTLLLDMQVGPAGFVKDAASGAELAATIARLSAGDGISVDHHIRDSRQLTGSCIGPPVELWEALAVMGAKGSAFATLDNRLVERQREVTSEIFGLLMARAGLGNSKQWGAVGLEHLRSGAALAAFRWILKEHGATADTLDQLLSDPLKLLNCKGRHTVLSARAGQISSIDLRRLGLIVNMGYRAGRNDFASSERAVAGVQLHVHLQDTVTVGQPLCTVHGAPMADFDLSGCFTVRP